MTEIPDYWGISNYARYRRKVMTNVEGAYGDIERERERGRVTKGEMEDIIGQFVEWFQRDFNVTNEEKDKLYNELIKYYKV